jgi:glycosyltransferase involved in cell wall biosynthesis
MTHVLMLSPVPPPRGGIGTWTELVLREAEKDPNVHLSVVDIAPRWRKVHQFGVLRRSLGGGLQLVRDFARTRSAILRCRPSVLHLCTSAQLAAVRDIFVLRMARAYGLRTVYHLHFGRLPELARSGGWEWRLIRSAISIADVVIALDSQTHRTIGAVFPGKTAVRLPNCVDVVYLDGISASALSSGEGRRTPRVTFIGHIIPTKGVIELVQAAVCLVRDVPFELELIGPSDPEYLDGIRAAGSPLGGRLLVRGELPHDEAMRALSQADVLALPSYTEGFPYVVLEAMALGRPVIGTSVGAIAEMLEGAEGMSGICVPPRDVAALSDALRTVLGNSKLRAEMGRIGRMTIETKCSAPVVFAQLKLLWQSRASKDSASGAGGA